MKTVPLGRSLIRFPTPMRVFSFKVKFFLVDMFEVAWIKGSEARDIVQMHACVMVYL